MSFSQSWLRLWSFWCLIFTVMGMVFRFAILVQISFHVFLRMSWRIDIWVWILEIIAHGYGAWLRKSDVSYSQSSFPSFLLHVSLHVFARMRYGFWQMGMDLDAKVWFHELKKSTKWINSRILLKDVKKKKFTFFSAALFFSDYRVTKTIFIWFFSNKARPMTWRMSIDFVAKPITPRKVTSTFLDSNKAQIYIYF